MKKRKKMDVQKIWKNYFKYPIAGILLLFVIVYLLLIGGSEVYLTSTRDIVSSPLTDFFEILRSHSVYGFSHNGPVVVEELNAFHAIRNIIYIGSNVLLLTPLPIISLVLGVFLLLYGLFTSDWSSFGLGILVAVAGTLLSVIIIPFAGFALWLFSLAYQDFTVAYFLIMLIVGLPFLALLSLFSSGTSGYIIIIIKPD